jgi:hypothetical protein
VTLAEGYKQNPASTQVKVGLHVSNAVEVLLSDTLAQDAVHFVERVTALGNVGHRQLVKHRDRS